MTVKYKLLKWYPSLPKHYKVGGVFCFYKGSHRTTNGIISKSEAENNPEFWEKVEEKDYEILSFKRIISNKIVKKGKELVSDQAMIHYLNDREWNIYSVKRLSDGEVFTVGDRVSFQNSAPFILKKIGISQHKPKAIAYHREEPKIGYYFDNIKHIKEPLFITEDGVDIYEGDSYSYISKKYISAGIGFTTASKNQKRLGTNLYFSTKEKAHEYIEWQVKKYSKKDVKDLLYKIHPYCRIDVFQFLNQI